MQKESFWRVKGVLLECKRSPFFSGSFLFQNLEGYYSFNEGQTIGGYGVLAIA